ncbi:acetylglutamate kinase [Agrilactobacillus composti DSM 18527 = JCM 14202]|uniref:acetylglutamate kinase n=1 Tax=Agrilactobacillus composti TaxID=398555 RepID=UPI00042E1442|nr:acetylglutamate kinase [Agrilactobacillus composti]GAF41573.1 acetylglutamate kinase [Agrilactobacillus composti DSM 18527 = JCM 14202]
MCETIVIKVGGNAISQMDEKFFQRLRTLQNQDVHIVLVHGGGPMISAACEAKGLSVVKRQGIRVTDAQTMAITQNLVINTIQPKLLKLMADHGLDAVGANLPQAQPVLGEFLNQQDFGFVGTPTEIPASTLAAIDAGKIVIFGPLCQTTTGTWLNVNADSMAAFVAQTLQVNRLILVTDVPGLMYYGHVMPNVHEAQIQRLIDGDILTSGMVPKVTAAYKAIKAGVQQVEILNDISKPGTLVLL